ncbi:BTA121 domain-containing protein surface lipoprotein [Borrelia persica]|uniref:BTA121 domain-containing protein surface lipoprotein n=1 Tax=Borrelia persica TaxID=44448 RepID=UPI0004649FF9|nr:hypothetical protein [Borrelia persica]
MPQDKKVSTIKDIKEHLNDREKVALAFLKDSLNRKDKFESLILYLDAKNLLIEKSLFYIVLTLDARDAVEEALRNYKGPDKYTLIQKLKDEEQRYIDDLRRVYMSRKDLNDLSHELLVETRDPFRFVIIGESIFNYIMTKQLNLQETIALMFLEEAIISPNPDDSDDYKLVTHSKSNFHMFSAYIGIDKLKIILSDVIETLKTKMISDEALLKYHEPNKYILTQRFKDIIRIYKEYLKRVCSFHSFDQVYYNLSLKTSNIALFKSIESSVRYYKIIELLNSEERVALSFLVDAITNPNPDDPDDCKLITHSKQTFYQCMLDTDNIDNLKAALADIVMTLSAYLTAGHNIEAKLRNKIAKDIYTSKLKDAETRYMKYLKSICSTSSADEIYSNLLNKTNNVLQFEIILSSLHFFNDTYNSIVKQLNEEEKTAFMFLENAISSLNSDAPDDRKLITNLKQTFYQYVLDIDDIDKFKTALLGIINTLSAKEEAEKVIVNYNGSDKDTFIRKLQNETTKYIKYLKSICDTPSVKEMYNNLSEKTNNALQFESITNIISPCNKVHDDIMKQLNEDEKDALMFLEEAIISPNPDDLNNHKIITQTKKTFNQFILDTYDINKFKITLSDIVRTLKEKRSVECVIANYNGPKRHTFIQELKDAETTYIKYLKNICNTSSVEELYNNLSKKTSNASQFESISSMIRSYDRIYHNKIKKLNEYERGALVFLEDSLSTFDSDDPDDREMTIRAIETFNWFYLFALDTDDIHRLKIALSDLVKTLDIKNTVELAIENYNESDKDVLTQQFKNEEMSYVKYLKSIFNTFYAEKMYNIEEMYNHLSREVYNVFTFKRILDTIDNYNAIYNHFVGQLDDQEKDAFMFLENAITKPNPDDPNNYEIITHTKSTFYWFVRDIGTEKLERVLSGVLRVLKLIKRVREHVLGCLELEKKLFRDEEIRYIKHLKRIFNTNYDIYDNFIRERYNIYPLASIVNGMCRYLNIFNEIVEQLSDEEKNALTFIEDAITEPNSDDPEDHGIIIRVKQNYSLFVNTHNIEKPKTILLQIVLTLNTKRIVEEAIMKYNNPGKNILVSILKNTEEKYMKHLKNLCNTPSVKEMCDYLSDKANHTFQFASIINIINSYNNVMAKLSEEEKIALTFLENSAIIYNTNDPGDYEITLRTKHNYNQLILNTHDIDKFKLVLANVVSTLKAKKELEEALANYNGLDKDALIRKFKNQEIDYMRYLKNILDIPSVEKMYNIEEIYNNLLRQTSNKSEFKIYSDIINSYNKTYKDIIKQLSDKEKNALTFLENAITKKNPDDIYDYKLITQTTQNYNQFISSITNIRKLKAALSHTVTILNKKSAAEEALKQYTKVGKNVLEQILKNLTNTYVNYLKIICGTFSKMYSSLLWQIDISFQFANFIETINFYGSIVTQLNNEERVALDFLTDAITSPNPDDYEITLRAIKTYNRFILDTNDIHKLKAALSGIVMTLNTRYAVQEALKEYTKPGKYIFAQKLEDAETSYVKSLKSICNTPSIKEMYDNLSSKGKNISQFESVANTISFYNNIIGKLNDEERNALIFLEKSITTPNPDDPDDDKVTIHAKQNYNRFILDSDDINKLKTDLSGIVATLKVKKEIKENLANYNGLDKETLTQKLEDAEAAYVKYLKNICSTYFVEGMYKILSKGKNISQFESITSTINFYNNIIGKLNDEEKNALIFLEKSITTPNSDSDDAYDHWITIQIKQTFDRFILDLDVDDIGKLKVVLADIVKTINAKEENTLQRYARVENNLLVQRLKDTETKYMKHLKIICNTFSVGEMRYNLSNKTNRVYEFKNIISSINFYFTIHSSVIEKLDNSEKDAFIFLENVVTTPNPGEPDDHGITVKVIQNRDLVVRPAKPNLSGPDDSEITMRTKDLFCSFILNTNNIHKIKTALSGIVLTLKAKKKIEKVIVNYNGLKKYTFMRKLKYKEIKYMKHLKSICDTSSVNEMYNNLSRKTNHSYQFTYIEHYISFYTLAYHNIINITDQLNYDEKDALAFLEESLTMCDPAYFKFITHTKDDFYLLISKMGIDKLKSALSDIVTTLKAKRAVEKVLEIYAWTAKDKFVQRLLNEKTNYIKHLRRICSTCSSDEMYNNLSRKTNHEFQFSIILIYINYYNKAYSRIIELLNDKDKDTLYFLENIITKPNPDEHEFIIHSKQNFNHFILEIGIEKFQDVVSEIMTTLNAKKSAKEALDKYDAPGKNILVQIFKNAETNYPKLLKKDCNTNDFGRMYSNLSRKTNNELLFENIMDDIQNYQKLIEALNQDERYAFVLLEKSVIKSNSENPSDYLLMIRRTLNLNRFILNESISKLQIILSKIILILNAKEKAEDFLVNYKGTSKNELVKKLRYEEARYVKDLQDSCDNFYGIYNNLLQIVTLPRFENIIIAFD